MHEIVTLQFGQRANYLATHFWNIQESYFTYAPHTEPSIIDHDIHFRPGIGTDGSETYTPRTVLYDLKGGLGTLKQLNALYDDTATGSSNYGSRPAPGVWNDHGLTTIKQQPIAQTAYQRDLDQGLPTRQLYNKDVRYWSDFNRVFLHPRSIVQLSEYTLNDSIRPFENWQAGDDLFREVDRQSGGILDRDVRLFVEECDAMQGFQVFSGVDDAWGGWMAEYVDCLRDEFGKKSIWVYGIEDERTAAREKLVARKANGARSLNAARSLVDAYVRLSTRPSGMPAYVRLVDNSSEWEDTGLMASAVESVTSPIRLRAGSGRGSSMAEFAQTLNTNDGQNVWDLGLNIDWNGEQRIDGQQENADVQAEDEGDKDDSKRFDIDFTPQTLTLLPNTLSIAGRQRQRKHVFAQVDTSRRPKRLSNGMVQPKPLGQEEVMRRRYNEEAIVERFTVPLGFPRLDAYPSTLFVLPESATAQVDLSLTSGFTTSSTMKQDVFDLRDLVTRYSRAVAVDEREDLYNGLTEVGERYNFGWESDGDSEDE